jgi:pyruvate dehydrogenase phosphatase
VTKGNVVMVSQTSSEDWNIETLTTNQNGDNEDEIERVRREHPGEPDCVLDQRVLGAIAPFRCKSHSMKAELHRLKCVLYV